jgi:hypothetical protein
LCSMCMEAKAPPVQVAFCNDVYRIEERQHRRTYIYNVGGANVIKNVGHLNPLRS